MSLLIRNDIFMRKKKLSQATIDDVLMALNGFSRDIQKRFDQMDQRFEQIDQHLEQIDGRFQQIDERFAQIDQRFDEIDEKFKQMYLRFKQIDERLDSMETRLTVIEATMVTKDYLDRKLAELRGDLITVIRKEDDKLCFLTETLATKDMLTPQEKHAVIVMEPFPKKIM